MSEKNYDFRKRHWAYHKPGRRDPERKAAENEVMLSSDWKIGFSGSEESIAAIAARDFQDYLEKSMGVPLALVR